MLLEEILLIWVFTAAPAIATLQTPDSLLSRMDQLESIMADHHSQFQRKHDQWEKEKQILQHERDQWEKDKQILQHKHDLWEKEKQILQHERDQWQKEKQILQHKHDLWEKEKQILQRDVHTLQKENQEMRGKVDALQNKQTLTQTLMAENQGLKAQLEDFQRQLLSMDSKQQSLQDRVTRCEGKARPGTVGEEQLGEEVRHTPGEQSGQSVHTSVHQGGSQQVTDHGPQHLSETEPFKQHVHTARSDDQGPWEAVTSHLAQQTTQLAADIEALKNADAQQRQDIQAARGSTFVHWGSSTCAGSSELVYSGIVGGSWYDHAGAAANTLCLTLSPSLLNNSPSSYALLYGAEYGTHDSHQDMDPVCGVCRSPQPTTIMVPGTNICSAGWTHQYSGFLMAGYYGHHGASEFICVDSKLGSTMNSYHNNDGHLLYYTKTRCGSLPCPPYVNDRVVTCAVCSK